MRVLVTGGGGFIGSHVADALLLRGHDVAILDDFSTGRRENVPGAAHLFEVDVRDRESVHQAVSAFGPEVVCHQAAQTSVAVSAREPAKDAEVNIIGGIHLLDACLAKGGVARVVFASTGGAIYGEVPAPERATSEWMPRPLSPYGAAKLAFERYLDCYRHEHGLESTVLRYANVYGPRQDPHGEAGVVAIFTERLLRGEPIRINAMREVGDDGCIRDYVYVDDVVRANVEAVEGRLTGVRHVATGVEARTRDVASALVKALSSKSEVGHGPRRAGDLERSVLEPEPLLGTPVTLADGLARTARWFLERR